MQASIVFFAFLWALCRCTKLLAWRDQSRAHWPYLTKWFNLDPQARKDLVDQMDLVEDIVNQAAVHSQKTLAEFKEGMVEVLEGDEFQSLYDQFLDKVILPRLPEQDDPSALAEKNVDELWNSLWKVMKFTTVDPTPEQMFTSFWKEGSSRMSTEHFTRQERTLSQRRTSLKKEKNLFLITIY